MRPRVAGGAHLCVLETRFARQFFLTAEARMTESVKIAVASLTLDICFLYRRARTARAI